MTASITQLNLRSSEVRFGPAQHKKSTVFMDAESEAPFKRADSIVAEARPSAMRKSVHDLPLDHHRGLLFDWETSHAEQQLPTFGRKSLISARQSTIADISVMEPFAINRKRSLSVHEEESNYRRVSRFQFLNPDILLKRLATRQSYEFLRDLAVQALTKNTLEQLRLLYNRMDYTKHTRTFDWDWDTVFGWEEEVFMRGFTSRSPTWIEILQKSVAPQALNMLKYRTDLVALIKYMNMLFRAFLHSEKTEEVVEAIEDTSDFYYILERTKYNLETHRSILRFKINSTAYTSMPRPVSDRQRKHELRNQLLDQILLNPIELRYATRFNQLQATQVELSTHLTHKSTRDQIKYYVQKTESESYCSQCTLNTHYTDIEKYKVKFKDLSAKYEHDLEEISGQTLYHQRAIEKLKNRQSSLTELLQDLRQQVNEIKATGFCLPAANSTKSGIKKYQSNTTEASKSYRSVFGKEKYDAKSL